MGATLGAFIDLFVVGRYWGAKAVILTTLLSLLLLGIACNLLCLNLDRYFQYFCGTTHPASFLVTGLVLYVLGGRHHGAAAVHRAGQRQAGRDWSLDLPRAGYCLKATNYGIR